MSNIWLPDTPKPKRITVSAEIITAKYHPVEKAIIVAVRLSNGQVKSMPTYPQNYTFHGRPATSVTTDEIDREMEKTAALYAKSKGRRIKIEMDESELE